MERKIGDTFEFEEKKLMVTEERVDTCEGCFFDGHCTRGNKALAGKCGSNDRDDGKNVVFMEVQEQQTEAKEQSQKLNLCEILKDCPKGWKFYSTIFEEVEFIGIKEGKYQIKFKAEDGEIYSVTSNGRHRYEYNGECTLFPSKDQRDWSKFTTPWLRTVRFDPKTLNPFDKVLVRDSDNESWFCDLFSHIKEENIGYKYVASSFFYYRCCIPYNDDTKHLVGTTDEAPDFYRYWED